MRLDSCEKRCEKAIQIDASGQGREEEETNLDPSESSLDVSVDEIEVFFDINCRAWSLELVAVEMISSWEV